MGGRPSALIKINIKITVGKSAVSWGLVLPQLTENGKKLQKAL
nr:MAG TPA: hypothetical protein [Inoviridae sp.]